MGSKEDLLRSQSTLPASMTKRKRATKGSAKAGDSATHKRLASSTASGASHDTKSSPSLFKHGEAERAIVPTLSPLEALPVEILNHILGELPFDSLLCMYFVSRHWRSLCPLSAL